MSGKSQKAKGIHSVSHGYWRKGTITHQDGESHKNDDDKEFSLGLLALGCLLVFEFKIPTA